MKKTICLILVVLLTLLTVTPAFAGNYPELEATPLRFNEDGKLKIIHLTDTHLSDSNVDDTVRLISLALDCEKPDVVMLTGDIAMDENREEHIIKLMTVFEERNIPVAVTFGNHDSESGDYTREEMMAFYNAFSCSISIDDGDALPWCGTYVVPVLASNSDKVKFNLWVFDSGDYDSEGHYSNVSEEQVKWYTEKSKEMEEENGEKINSLVFQHIIVPEIYEALSRSKTDGLYKVPHMYDDGYYYYFNPEMENTGLIREQMCCGYYNHGQFDAMVERGDVLGMFFGHDHTNSFSVKYKGINITNSIASRYQRDAFSTQYGYRIIEVDEKDTTTYTTKVVQWYDFITIKTVADALKADDKETAELAADLSFRGAFQSFFQRLAYLLVTVFSFRQVYYPNGNSFGC